MKYPVDAEEKPKSVQRKTDYHIPKHHSTINRLQGKLKQEKIILTLFVNKVEKSEKNIILKNRNIQSVSRK